MDDSIEFTGGKKTRNITVWVREEDRALYDLLKTEYGVDISQEMRKAIVNRLQFLKDQVVPSRAG